MFKNNIELTKKAKDNKNEIFTSNWNHSSNYKLNTHNNENILYRNKFFKDTPIRDILLDKNKKFKGVILPSIKTPKLIINRNIVNENKNSKTSPLSKIGNDIIENKNINYEMKNELFTEKTNLFKDIKVNTNSNYINDNTQATTIATNSTKKYNYSNNNNIKNINEDSGKYGMDLITVESTTNNNIIIPILTMRRPVSNVNKGRDDYNNFNENENIIGDNKKNENSRNIENKKLINFCNNSRNKNCKSQEIKGRFNASMKNKPIFNLFPGMQKLLPNYHKIKIEKGMPNIKLVNSLHQKFKNDNNII